jgi:hypothetical protein
MSKERRVPTGKALARSYEMLAQAYLEQDKKLRDGFQPIGEMAPGRAAFQEAVREIIENGGPVSKAEIILNRESDNELL